MKPPAVLLVGSLVANAALIATLTFRTAPAGSASDAEPVPAAESADPHAAERGAWKALRGDDAADSPDLAALADFVGRLRESGFPPPIVRLLTEFAVREQLASRRQAVLASARVPDEFWKAEFNGFNRFDPETRSSLRELAREERGLLRQLLGDDYEAGQEHRWADQRRYYGNLSSEKIEQLQDIVGDYSELRAELRGGGMFNNITLPEDREKLAYLEREMQQDIAALLSPEELAEYELRTSRSLWNLRNTFANIDLSDEEFHTIHSLQKAFDEEFWPRSAGAAQASAGMPELAKRRGEAEKTLIAEVKALLGEPRASDYERARDYSYRSLEQVTERLGLPRQTAVDAYALQKDIQQRAASLRSDRTLSNEQRTAKLDALVQEATDNLSAKFGADGLQAYKSNGGQWLDRLSPRAPAAASNPTGVISYRLNN